jgi:hypothetical protein
MARRPEDKRYPIGNYGAGTLWFERNERGRFILFGAVRIAEFGCPGTPQEGTWISLEPGWKGTSSPGCGRAARPAVNRLPSVNAVRRFFGGTSE